MFILKSGWASRLLLPFLLTCLLLFAAGCRRKPLPAASIRAITREMVLAVRNAAPGGVAIGMRPEAAATPEARAQSRARAGIVDYIYITLPGNSSGRIDPEALAAVEKELDRVANRYQLLRAPEPGAEGVVRFSYRRGDQQTHSIHIISPMIVVSGSGGGAARARLSIIIDDLGYDRAAANELFALKYPLTVSVLPHLPYSAEVAEEAHRRGYQVILHLPMASDDGVKEEASELRPGMDSGEVARVVIGMLNSVPYAIGANNHQGSRSTANPALMAEVMPVLREHGLFFIDSRTTTATVAYQEARHAHVSSASRNVFLDDVETVGAVREQLETAARDARRQGFAIAIGHPHRATLQALAEYLPELEARGIRLVFASQVVR